MNAKTITALIFADGSSFAIPNLKPFGINATMLAYEPAVLPAIMSEASCDVIVLTSNGDVATAVACLSALRIVQQESPLRDVGVCLCLDHTATAAVEGLGAGADSIAFREQAAGLVALAFFTAFHAGILRRALNGKVRELEDKLEQTRLINHAKSLIAKQLGVAEHDALMRLRKESRNQRRPMVELARVVIEANRIMSGAILPHAPGTQSVPDGSPFSLPETSSDEPAE